MSGKSCNRDLCSGNKIHLPRTSKQFHESLSGYEGEAQLTQPQLLVNILPVQ